jgi:hypothetical protein
MYNIRYLIQCILYSDPRCREANAERKVVIVTTTPAVLETTARPIDRKGSITTRHSKDGRRNQRAGKSDLKSGFTISATLLGDGSVEAFFGSVRLIVTPRNEAAVEALLKGTLASRRIDAMFGALSAT